LQKFLVRRAFDLVCLRPAGPDADELMQPEVVDFLPHAEVAAMLDALRN